jgi:hypothetical protein
VALAGVAAAFFFLDLFFGALSVEQQEPALPFTLQAELAPQAAPSLQQEAEATGAGVLVVQQLQEEKNRADVTAARTKRRFIQEDKIRWREWGNATWTQRRYPVAPGPSKNPG